MSGQNFDANHIPLEYELSPQHCTMPSIVKNVVNWGNNFRSQPLAQQLDLCEVRL